MTDSTVQPFDYTGRDFVSLRDQLKAYFQGRVPEWVADPSDMGYILIEAMAYMGDMLSYYVDIAAQESNLLSANSPGNVFAQALLFGYQPSLAISAETELSISSASVDGGDREAVELSQGSQVFDARTGLTFELDTSVNVPYGGVVVARALEGKTVSRRIGTSSGAPGQRMTVPLDAGMFVDGREGKTSLVVGTQYTSTTWLPTYNLLDHGPSDRVYALVTDAYGNTTVMFGDGNSGAIPPKGGEVVLTYRMCSGVAGNYVAPGSINQWYTSYDSPVSLGSLLSVTNISSPVGGSGVESIDDVRLSAINFARAQRRAVSTADYERVARASGEVLVASSRAAVWSQPRVWILPREQSVLTQGGERAARILKTVDDALEKLCMIGTSPVVSYGRIAKVTLEVEARVWEPVDVRRAEALIRQALLDEFSYAKCDFDREISEDVVLRVIRDRIDDDIVRFARVSKISGAAGATAPLGLYPGTSGEDADFSAMPGVAPRDGFALVVEDATLKITVVGSGQKFVG